MGNEEKKNNKKLIIITASVLVAAVVIAFIGLYFSGILAEDESPAKITEAAIVTPAVNEDKKSEKTPDAEKADADTTDDEIVETEKLTNSLHTRFNQAASVIGLTGKQIKNKYGELTHAGYWNGGDFFNVAGLPYSIIFSAYLTYAETDKVRVKKAYSAVCTGVAGSVELMFPSVSYYGDDGIEAERFASDIAGGAKYELDTYKWDNENSPYSFYGDMYIVYIKIRKLDIYIETRKSETVMFNSYIEILNKNLQ
jgi:hypothetical protein